uniref:Bim_fulldiff n=1 Tax=synthetic construct TaxID=32630 RepID=UPI002B4186DB|nr:Chain A, Bim_fulldiff [synthetic construct]
MSGEEERKEKREKVRAGLKRAIAELPAEVAARCLALLDDASDEEFIEAVLEVLEAMREALVAMAREGRLDAVRRATSHINEVLVDAAELALEKGREYFRRLCLIVCDMMIELIRLEPEQTPELRRIRERLEEIRRRLEGSG